MNLFISSVHPLPETSYDHSGAKVVRKPRLHVSVSFRHHPVNRATAELRRLLCMSGRSPTERECVTRQGE